MFSLKTLNNYIREEKRNTYMAIPAHNIIFTMSICHRGLGRKRAVVWCERHSFQTDIQLLQNYNIFSNADLRIICLEIMEHNMLKTIHKYTDIYTYSM